MVAATSSSDAPDATSRLLAVWGVTFRVHGITLALSRYEVAQHLAPRRVRADSEARVILEFTREPTEIPKRPAGSPFRTEGANEPEELEDPEQARFGVHGSWLRITATEKVQVSKELYEAWVRDPQENSRRALEAVGDQVLEKLKERADLAAGGLAVLGDGVVLEEWASFLAIGRSEDKIITLTPVPLYELLPPYTLALEKLPHIMAAVGPLIALDDDMSKVLIKALRWYSRGRQERAGTVERFMGLFLSIEALTALSRLDQKTTPSRRELSAPEQKKLQLLRNAVADHWSSDALQFLNSLVADYTKPTLVSRFRWLATHIASLAPPHLHFEIDADVVLFRKFKALRDQLSHGIRSDVPFVIDRQQADNLLLAFVNRYVRTLVLIIGASGQQILEMDVPPVRRSDPGDV